MNKREAVLVFAAFTTLLCGCGHTKVSRVGVLSIGNLEGKRIPAQVNGPVLVGTDRGHVYQLSDAVRNALRSTGYDTLVDVEVTSKTGLFVPSNCITVRGKALSSASLKGGR